MTGIDTLARTLLRDTTPTVTPVAPGIITTAAPLSADEKKLRKSANDLQGLFVAQMFKAMRDTVPQDEGEVSGGNGEDIFTGLMDEHIAADTPTHWSGGISEALYRQLRTALPGSANSAANGVSTLGSDTTQGVQSSDGLSH
jgi:flagellar protein FlgJ